MQFFHFTDWRSFELLTVFDPVSRKMSLAITFHLLPRLLENYQISSQATTPYHILSLIFYRKIFSMSTLDSENFKSYHIFSHLITRYHSCLEEQYCQ